jgi:hypothetical protein
MGELTGWYEDRRHQPAVTVYLLSDDSQVERMKKISCMFCKNTLCRISGQMDKVISTPMPLDDVHSATEIPCKKCHQMWLLCTISDVAIVIEADSQQR